MIGSSTKKRGALATLALAAATTAFPAQADDVADFYRNRQVTIVVPTGPGGTYALYGQAIVAHMPRHLPGNPTMVLQFIPSGVKATQQLYNASPKDGSFIGMLSQTAPALQVLRPDNTKYDMRQFGAIGIIASLNAVLTVSDKAPAKDLEGMKKVEVALGATDRSSYQYQNPAAMNRYLGTKFKIVTGYKGIAGTTLAMERGEVDGVFTSWLAIKKERPDIAFEGKGGRVVAQIGPNKESDLDAPLLSEIAPTPQAKRAFAFLGSANAVSRSLIAPPGVPAERLAALRTAFDKMIVDPMFRAELDKRKVPLRAKGWREMQQILKETVETPKTDVE